MGLPKLGVVTVLYNSAAHLVPFLESVNSQTAVEVDLIVVDNASSDTGARMVENFPFGPHVTRHLILNTRNNGVAAGNNQGIEVARNLDREWILILNNDTEFSPTMFATLHRTALDHETRLLSPVIAAEEPPGILWYGGGRTVAWQGHRVVHDGSYTMLAEDRLVAGVERTSYAPTCCLLVESTVFDEVGVMDPSYFVYFDDTDFSIRCTKHGISTFVTANATILHKAGGSTGGALSPVTLRWSTRNWALLARRHLPWFKLAVALAYIQLWILGRLLLRFENREQFAVRQRSFLAGLRFPKDNHLVIFADALPA